MTTNFYPSSDFSITQTNTRDIILPKLTSLEKQGKVAQIVYDVGSTLPSTLLSTSFNFPKYLRYVNTIDYTAFSHPTSQTFANPYALKILAYIKITTAGQYVLATNSTLDKIKVYLNNYLILDNMSLTAATASTELYLNVGTYLVYIEKLAPSNDTSLTLTLTPRTITTATSTTGTISISTYISPDYRPLENAINSRNNAITTYCTPSATNSNLFSIDTTNVCNKSLTDTDLLSSIFVDTYCFPSGAISKNTTNKLNDNCKTIYDRTTLNANIKNNFNTKWKDWANSVINNNTITTHKDALEQYLLLRTPTETEFPFHVNIKNYCENDAEVKKNYDVTTQSNNVFCRDTYKRTYTTNKSTVDTSIQQIKNNYCDPNQTIANLTTTNCTNEYKNRADLKDAISRYCFIPNSSGTRDIRKNTLDGKYNNNCSNIHKLAGLNTNIKTELDNQYKNWATNITTNTMTKFTDHDSALNEYIINQDPVQGDLFGANNTVTATLTEYCENQISPNKTKYSADNNTNTFCNTLYNKTKLNTHPEIIKSINKIKTDYCTTLGADGKPRYETDSNCKNDYTGLLSSTIASRCIPNNTFQYNDIWCVSTSDTGINNTSVPYTSMRTARTTALKNEASIIEVKDYPNKKFLNDNNYKYATGSYNAITDSANKKLSDELLTNKLFQYCENKEPNYPTDPTSQCKGIYDLYKGTNISVRTSRDKMRDELCKSDTNIITDTIDDNTNNTYKCKSTIFDTTKDIDKFGPVVNTYCNKGDNIATSNDCKTYYENIEGKILDALNLKINAAPINISPFSNKYYQTSSNMVEDYDKKYELSTFENPPATEQPSTEQPVTEQSATEQSATDTIQPIYYAHVQLECPYENEENNNDSMWLSLLLFFIFVILIVGLFSSCMYNKNHSKIKKNETNTSTSTRISS